jgi:hypothetical protein
MTPLKRVAMIAALSKLVGKIHLNESWLIES